MRSEVIRKLRATDGVQDDDEWVLAVLLREGAPGFMRDLRSWQNKRGYHAARDLLLRLLIGCN